MKNPNRKLKLEMYDDATTCARHYGLHVADDTDDREIIALGLLERAGIPVLVRHYATRRDILYRVFVRIS